MNKNFILPLLFILSSCSVLSPTPKEIQVINSNVPVFFYNDVGEEISPPPIFYDKNELVGFQQSLPHLCDHSYHTTGKYIRWQSDPFVEFKGIPINYQVFTIRLPSKEQISSSTYKNLQENMVPTGFYAYGGGQGAAKHGQAVDVGPSWDEKRQSFSPYIQVNGEAIGTKVTENGKIYYYRIKPGAQITVTTEVIPEKTIKDATTGKDSKVNMHSTFTTSRDSWVKYDAVTNKEVSITGSDPSITLTIEYFAEGWAVDYTANKDNGIGQPMKFATSIAWNLSTGQK